MEEHTWQEWNDSIKYMVNDLSAKMELISQTSGWLSALAYSISDEMDREGEYDRADEMSGIANAIDNLGLEMALLAGRAKRSGGAM